MCVASAAHFSWKRALIAISSNAHHGKDEVISPAPSLSRFRQEFARHLLCWAWVGIGVGAAAEASLFWVGLG